jgi:hypothetical protein
MSYIFDFKIGDIWLDGLGNRWEVQDIVFISQYGIPQDYPVKCKCLENYSNNSFRMDGRISEQPNDSRDLITRISRIVYNCNHLDSRDYFVDIMTRDFRKR